jgi:hypothetical protein
MKFVEPEKERPMTMRVLAGPEAIDEANRMRQTIESGLDAQLAALEASATRLSDPNVWDGPHAVQFRGLWQEMAPRLRRSQADLSQLRAWIHGVTDSIILAGGGS